MAESIDSFDKGTEKPPWRGVHCIAPGCTNYYSKNNNVHYHRLPLNRPQELRRWLQKLKLSKPPVNQWARVCSVHFVSEDYESEMKMVDGRYKRQNTNKLLPGAFPSVLDFSGYSLSSTDAPSTACDAASRDGDRGLRLQQRKEHQYQRKVCPIGLPSYLITVNYNHDLTPLLLMQVQVGPLASISHSQC
jgi:hypothetical protein